jgi:hypothetical protein
MAELVTVYRSQPENVGRVVQFLRSHNLNPTVVEDPGQMTAYRAHSHEVCIAVPASERDTALGVLAEMEKCDESRLAPQIKVANGIVLLLVLILGLVAIVAFLDRGGKLFIGVWALIVAVIAAALLRHAWRKPPA